MVRPLDHLIRSDIMKVVPINSKKIYQNIIEQFIGLINNGELKIGDKLPSERTLAEMFKVSRASIREAFSAMEIIGLIDVRPGEGSFITPINIGPFINTISPLLIQNDKMETDLLDFRKLIEVEAIKLLAEKSDKSKFSLLQKPLDLMIESIENDIKNNGAVADIIFHKTVFELTDNLILIKAAECTSYLIQKSIQFNRKKILRDTHNSLVLYNQHKAMYKAISEGDSNTAADIMSKHLDFVRIIDIEKIGTIR